MVEPKKRVVLMGSTELIVGRVSKIYSVRNSRVVLSDDLAELFGVGTKILLQAVRRNLGRFPDDFQFSIANHESTILSTNA